MLIPIHLDVTMKLVHLGRRGAAVGWDMDEPGRARRGPHNLFVSIGLGMVNHRQSSVAHADKCGMRKK